MTRTRNGSISGTFDYDADIDAPTFKRVLLELAQDVHMLYDSLTGENFPGNAPIIQTIDHGGDAGAGSLLGMTSWQQKITARPGISEADMPTYAINGGGVVLLAKPHYVCAGEYELNIGVDAGHDTGPYVCHVLDASGAMLATQEMREMPSGQGPATFTTRIGFVTFGVQVYILIRRVWEHVEFFRIFGWRGIAGRAAQSIEATRPGITDDFKVTAPASGAAMAWELLHDEMFTNDYAVPGHIITDLNRKLNAMWEYVTGSPVPGNNALHLVDEGGDTAPTASRFKANGRTVFASEPLIDFPVGGEALGAFGWDGAGEAWSLVDTADPPAAGMTEWFAPYVKATTETRIHSMIMQMPDFSEAEDDLCCTVMIASEMQSSAFKYTPTNWSVRIRNETTGSYSGSVAFSQIGSTPFLSAIITGVPFSRDELNELHILIDTSGAYTFGELALLGYDFTFHQ